MKYSEMKNKSVDELKVLLGNFKKELFNLRFQRANGTLTSTARFSVVRKSIAKVLTVLNSSNNGGK